MVPVEVLSIFCDDGSRYIDQCCNIVKNQQPDQGFHYD